ncbi:MAG: hypothetical protein P1P88_17970, partial [Bacteroidales bacterium]|nr:hypothetical protein [Bacteroidales bacterium]
MMKKMLRSLGLLLLVGLMFGFNSCEKVAEALTLPSMKATVDDVEWNSLFRASVYNQSDAQPSIVITGTPTASQTADKTIIL